MTGRRHLVAMAAACTLMAPEAAGAETVIAVPAKSSIAEICVFRAAVHDTPRGLVIGYLHEEARVKLLGHTRNRRWYRVRGPLRLVGWLKARNICR